MIGVVDPAGRLGALDARGWSVQAGTADEIVSASPTAVLGVGDEALVRLANARVTAPILPVALEAGIRSIAVDDAMSAVEHLESVNYDTTRHPLVGVTIGDEHVGSGVFDAMIVRSEAGRISEYRIEASNERSRFRADGVVVTTPLGSYGYGRAAGGPVIVPESNALAVLPVGAFAIDIDHWVVDDGSAVTVAIERDEGTVELLIDGRPVGTVLLTEAVQVQIDGDIRTIDVTDELEKL